MKQQFASKLLDMQAPDGYLFLVTVPNYWGKGVTIRDAYDKAKKAGYYDREGDDSIMVQLVDFTAWLDETGMNIIKANGGKPTIEVGVFHADRRYRVELHYSINGAKFKRKYRALSRAMEYEEILRKNGVEARIVERAR